MPYTVTTMPDDVKKRLESSKDRARWVAVWNAAHAKAKKDGKSDKDAEQTAFVQANGVTKNTEGSDELVQRLVTRVVKPEYLTNGQGSVSSEPNTDYLGKLRDLIKSRMKDGDLSDEDVRAIMRAAAGYAGGMAKARKRVTSESFAAAEGDSLWVGFWLPPDVAEEIALPGGEAASELHLTLAYLGNVSDLPDDATERVRIAVQAFALTVQPFDLCLNGVSRFDAENGGNGKDVIYATVDCEQIQDFRWRLCMALYEAGLTPRSDHAFTPHVTLAYVEPGTPMTVRLPDITFPLDSLTVATSHNASDRETFPLRGMPYRDMMPLQMAERAMIEPPATIPVLPKPGSYAHPVYGTIDMTPERIASFVDNFGNHVYQDRLPIDLEHETKLSGAAGWITNLVTNADGSVDAAVEWNERGAEALRDDRFLYVSPEWYDEWRDPIDGNVHQNILMGAALTTRPFFKPAALRSLAASEGKATTTMDLTAAMVAAKRVKAIHKKHMDGTMSPDDPGYEKSEQDIQDAIGEIIEALSGEMPYDKGGKMTGEATKNPGTASVVLTEEQAKRFADLEADNARMTAELAASKTAAEQAAEQSKKMAERLAAIEQDTRRKRFTAEVTGRSESGGPRWFGEPDKHVAVLEHLADTVGESHDLFTGYVSQQRALAEQLKSSTLFREAGVGSRETSEDPQQQIVALAEKRAAEKGIGIGEAQRQVVAENPDLARRAGQSAAVRV